MISTRAWETADTWQQHAVLTIEVIPALLGDCLIMRLILDSLVLIHCDQCPDEASITARLLEFEQRP